jgi:hypothetical protein
VGFGAGTFKRVVHVRGKSCKGEAELSAGGGLVPPCPL